MRYRFIFAAAVLIVSGLWLMSTDFYKFGLLLGFTSGIALAKGEEL